MSLISEREIEEIRNINEKKKVKLPDGTFVPALGQGTWYLGENASNMECEIRTLRLEIEFGMTFIDTAEMYGDGKAERLVGKAISEIRDKIFLVLKVYPHNAGAKNIFTKAYQKTH
ncbi:MAG TPA: hypothetical protein DC034_01710 [Clostridium sp.]|uniref:Aldo/keto reductase n=1 Tax=Clostridium lapidicellarium TaxID=3240931 RepID=A0ABV4E1N4_9CLOT|nr:hypothetical protein [Clostridiales bacterium]HBC95494.1 hypothetical protein [Clostridium sp.]